MSKKTGGLVFFGVIAIALYAFGVKFFEAISKITGRGLNALEIIMSVCKFF